jgi:hypothetical protein
MGKCPICGSETYPTADPYIDICINSSSHRPYLLRRKKPRSQFDESQPEFSPAVIEQLRKSCPRGGCDDG